MYYPNVIEKEGRNNKPVDILSRLLQDRIIYINDGITHEIANLIVMELLWLNSTQPNEDVDLYINSPGGDISAGLAILDIINKVQCKVNTIGIGRCMSMGAYLLAAGTGERKAFKNCRIMLHSLSTGFEGNIHDYKIDYEESIFMHEQMMKDLSKFSKLSLEKIKEITQRDKYMSSEEALKYGFIDKVL